MDRPMPKPAELSKRLRLALDRAAIRRGAPVQFPEVRAFLTGQGLHISRAVSYTHLTLPTTPYV